VVVERRRAQFARERQQLRHRLRCGGLDLVQLGAQLRRRVGLDRLQAQEHAGQRLVDLVVQVAGDPRALGLLGVHDRG
jgi:hypothetical protein